MLLKPDLSIIFPQNCRGEIEYPFGVSFCQSLSVGVTFKLFSGVNFFSIVSCFCCNWLSNSLVPCYMISASRKHTYPPKKKEKKRKTKKKRTPDLVCLWESFSFYYCFYYGSSELLSRSIVLAPKCKWVRVM